MSPSREQCAELDERDPLAAHRGAFALPDGVIYLDGNSLGALPAATSARLRDVVEREWGRRLIGAWDDAGWLEAPRRIGAKIAKLIGAHEDEVICADSTSINLFKVLGTALRLQGERPRVAVTDRNVVLTERGNFPTDLYVAQALAEMYGARYRLVPVPATEIAYHIDETTAVVLLTHVNYRTGAMHELASLTRRAHYAGALALWDLAHSAGAVPLDLGTAEVDFAVGCGYKYLNGGPGAPAFVYAARRHLRAIADDAFAQPLAGWFGHREPFAFAPEYQPARSIDRFAVGTPSILALAALDSGIDTVLAAGVDALREKSLKQTGLFIELVDDRCAGLGLMQVTPRDAQRRGSQVCYAHEQARSIMAALVRRGVVGDYRDSGRGEPGILRFGFAPLYLRYVDVYDAVEVLRDALASHT